VNDVEVAVDGAIDARATGKVLRIVLLALVLHLPCGISSSTRR